MAKDNTNIDAMVDAYFAKKNETKVDVTPIKEVDATLTDIRTKQDINNMVTRGAMRNVRNTLNSAYSMDSPLDNIEVESASERVVDEMMNNARKRGIMEAEHKRLQPLYDYLTSEEGDEQGSIPHGKALYDLMDKNSGVTNKSELYSDTDRLRAMYMLSPELAKDTTQVEWNKHYPAPITPIMTPSEDGLYHIGENTYTHEDMVSALSGLMPVAQHNRLLKYNKHYRDDYARSLGYKNWDDAWETPLKNLTKELEAINEELASETYDKMVAASAYETSPATEGTALGTYIAEMMRGGLTAQQELEKAKALKADDFLSGFDEGFNTVEVMSLGYAGIGASVNLYNILEKVNNGQTLSEREEKVYRAYEIGQELEHLHNEFRGGNMSRGRRWGQGVGTSTEAMAQFAASMAATGGIGSGIAAANTGIKQAFKQGLKSGLKQTVKMGGKKAGVYGARSAVAAGISPMTYSTFADRRVGQYRIDESGNLVKETRPWAKDLGIAYVETFNEYFSEYFGNGMGKLIDVSPSKIGRVFGLDKWAGKKGYGNIGDYLDATFVPTKRMREAMHHVDFAGFVWEAPSEAFGDFMNSLMLAPFSEEHGFEQFTTKEYWEDLYGTTAIFGGSLSVLGSPVTIANMYNTSKNVKRREAALGKIQDVDLRNNLKSVMSLESMEDMSQAMVDLHIEKLSPDQAAAAIEYLTSATMVKVLTGADMEDTRLLALDGYVKNANNIVYKGKDGSLPSDEIIQVVDKSGRELYVEAGDVNDTSDVSMLKCKTYDAENRKWVDVAVPASEVMGMKRESVEQVISAEYERMFGTEIMAERLKEIEGARKSMENPSAEVVRGHYLRNGLKVYDTGAEISLADGRTAVVESMLADGSYLVRSVNPITQTEELYEVPFMQVLQPEASLAEAQKQMFAKNIESATQSIERAEATEQSAEAGVAEEEDVDADMEDVVEQAQEMPKPVPTREDGSVDFGAVDDPKMFATEYAKKMGGEDKAKASVAKMAANARAEASQLREKSDKMTDPNEVVDAVAKADAMNARADFYDKVLAEYTPQEEVQSEAYKAGDVVEYDGRIAEVVGEENEGVVIADAQGRMTVVDPTTLSRVAEAPAEENAVDPIEDADDKLIEATEAGIVQNVFGKMLDARTANVIDAMAKALGVKVAFVESVMTQAGTRANADIKGNVVRIAWAQRKKAISFLAGHEFTHRMKDMSPEAYAEFTKSVKEYLGEAEWQRRMDAQRATYELHNKRAKAEGKPLLSYEDTLLEEEVVADFVGDMVENRHAFEHYVQKQSQKPSLLQAIKKVLSAIGRFFRRMGARTEAQRMKEMIAHLDTFINKARKDAKKNGVQGSGARFSLSSTPIFFSNAQYAVQNIKQEKATPEQWLKMIEKNGGLKAGEDKWLGLSDWLKASDKKILSKEDVLQYIAENDIQIEEVEYGDVEDSARFKELYIEYNALYYEYGRNSERAFEEMLANYGDDFGIAFEAAGDELWVRDSEAAEVFVDINSVNDTRLQYTTDGLNNKREIALVVPTIEPYNQSDNIHFGDAGEGRAVAWIRFGETTDADGKRVLVIDEIQSKRHQDGREKGYRDETAYRREKAKLDELEAELFERRQQLIKKLEEKYGSYDNYLKSETRGWRTGLYPNEEVMTPEEIAEYNATDLESNIYTKVRELKEKYLEGVPSAPFEKNWAELAFKRMLRYAAENGYDYVAWTTGDQQADRYDIGSVVKDIVTYDTKDADGNPIKKMKFRMNNMGTYNIATNMEGVIVKGDGEMKEGMRLSDITGKTLAEKIMNGEGEDAMVFENGKDIEAKSLEGEELHIGNEGMKGFYDQMLPSFVKKYTKKWGAEVGEVTMPELEENNTMHAVNVTDSMRESVIQGQPKFSLPSLVGVHNLSLDKLRKVIKMGGLANPSVAVIDVDKQTHDDYGEYSLILPKNMVDARQGKNAGTWAGDAWTPTYPQVVKRMNDDKAISRFYKDIDALPEAMRSRVRLDFDSFMDGRSANALAYWYLFEKGNAPEMVLVPSRYSNDVTNAVSEATKGSFSMFNLTPEERAKCLDAYIAVKFDGDRAAFEVEMQARIERLAETIETKKSDRVKKWAQDTIDSIKEYGFDYDDVAEFIRDVEYDGKEKGKVNVDATIMAAQERINESNLAAEYDAWRNNLDERYGIDEFIFDGYTNSGNRRYLPHTVENASKWMKKQGREGATASFPSFGTFVAVSIPKMTTLESIRKRKASLGKSKEEYDAFREKWENVYYELGKKLQPDAKSFEDYGYWRLIEAVGQKNPKEFIKKEYGVELSEVDMTQLNEMLNAIRTEYPARYFETKFERPLQLSDFTAAVVPNDIPLDVESRLKDANVEVIEYKKGDNASRAEAMQKASQMENVRFSLQETLITPEMDAAYLDAVNRGDMETAQKMVMEAAKLAMPNTKVVDEDGNPKVVYHGTPNNFNAFSKEMFGASTDRGIWGNGFYFSDSEQYAKTYEKRGDKQGRTLTVFLNIENPLFISLRNGGNEGAMYFHELMEKHFTDDIYEDVTRTDELMSVAQERLTADIVANGYDGIVVEYTNHIDTEYVAFEPNQIKSADPVTYDDAGNVIPLSERFNPEKEDIRYSISSEEDARFERKVAFLTDLVREYNIPLPTFIAQTKEEFKRMAVEYGIPENEVNEDKCMGCYASDDEIIIVNGGLMRKPSNINNTLLHEYAHYVSEKYLKEGIVRVAQTLNDSNVKAMHTEFFEGDYDYLDKEGIIDEVVSYMVGYLQIEKTKPTFEGKISAQEHVDAWKKEIANSKYSNDVKEVLYAALPLVKENLDLQKKQYGAEKANTIVIARKQYDGNDAGGNTRAQIYGGAKYRPFKAEPRVEEANRGGEGADAKEVGYRHSLSEIIDTPSDEEYKQQMLELAQQMERDAEGSALDKAQEIADVTGWVYLADDEWKYYGDVDITEDAKESTRVRRWLESKAAVRKTRTRKMYDDLIKEQKKMAKELESESKARRSNASYAKAVDAILQGQAQEALPIEDQILVDVALGQKLRWEDEQGGSRRGLKTELGLRSTTAEGMAEVTGGNTYIEDYVAAVVERNNGYERDIDDNDVRNAVIEVFGSYPSRKAALEELSRRYPDTALNEANDAIAQLEHERDEALAQIDADLRSDLANAEANPAQYERAYEEEGTWNLQFDIYTGALRKARNEVSRMERDMQKAKLTQREKTAAMRTVKRAVVDMLKGDLGRYTRKRDIQALMDAVNEAQTLYAMQRAIDKAMLAINELRLRKETARMNNLLKMRISSHDSAIDPRIFFENMMKGSKNVDTAVRRLMNDYWRGTNSSGIDVAKGVDGDTARVLQFIRNHSDLTAELGKAPTEGGILKRCEAWRKELRGEAVETSVFSDTERKEIEALTPEVRERMADAVSVIEGYLMVQYQLQNMDEGVTNARQEIAAEKAQIKKLNKEIKALQEQKVAVTDGRIVDAKKEIEERKKKIEQINRDIASVRIMNAGVYIGAMPDILDAFSRLNAQVESLLMGGRVDLADFRAKREAHKRELVNMVLEALDNPEALDRNKPEYTAWQKVKDTGAVRFFTSHLGSLDYMLRSIDRNAPNGEGMVHTYFSTKLADAKDAIYENSVKAVDILNSKAQALFGTTFGRAMRKAERKVLGTMPMTRTKEDGTKITEEYEMTVATALYTMMMWNQPASRLALENMGATEEDIEQLRTWLNANNPAWLQFAGWVVNDFLPSNRARYNEVYRAMNGTDMDFAENYFPIRRMDTAIPKEVDLADPSFENKPSTVTGAIIKRTENKLPIDLETSFFGALQDNIVEMEEWSALAPIISDFNAILSSPAVKKAMGDMGKYFHKDFQQAAKVATLKYAGDTKKLDGIFWQMVYRTWASAKLAFKAFTALKQLASSVLFLPYSGDPKFIGRLLHYYLGGKSKLSDAVYEKLGDGSLTNREEGQALINIKWAYENSSMFRRRWDSGVAGNDIFTRELKYDSRTKAGRFMRGVSEVVNWLQKLGMAPIAFIDAYTVSAGMRAIYEYELANLTQKEGYTKEEAKKIAMRRAEMIANKSQQSSEGEYLAPLQMERGFITSLTMFQNAPFAQGRNIAEAWTEITRNTDKEYAFTKKQEIARMKKARAAEYEAIEATIAMEKKQGIITTEEQENLRREKLQRPINAEIEAQAHTATKTKIVRAKIKAYRTLAYNAFFGPFVFNLMGKIPYLLFGDDEEKKKKMWIELGWLTAFAPVSTITVGGTLMSILGGHKVSFSGALSEFEDEWNKIISEYKNDGFFEAMLAAGDFLIRKGFGVDYETFMRMYAGIENMFESGMSAENIFMALNAPDSQVRLLAGDRKEGETAQEYATRIMRLYSIISTPEYSDYYNEKFSYRGENPAFLMSDYMARGMKKNWEMAYRSDVMRNKGLAGEWSALLELEEEYENAVKSLGFKANKTPAYDAGYINDEYRAPIEGLSEDDFYELKYLAGYAAAEAKYAHGYIGDNDDDYLSYVRDEMKAKREFIDEYNKIINK